MIVLSEKKITSKYKTLVKKYERKLKTNGVTNNVELKELGQANIKHFTGVYMQDTKIKHNKGPQSYIINNEKEGEGGEHWIAVHKTKNKTFYIYDSFGRTSKKLISTYIKNKIYIDSDLDAEQGLIEENCGQRCLAWLECVDSYGIRNAIKI